VPLTLDVRETYRTENKLKLTENMQVQYNSEKKQTMQNTAKQNYPGSVIFYNTRTTKRGWVTMSRSQDGAMWNYHSGVVVF